MVLHHATQGLIGHPSDAFQLVFQQQARIYSDFHDDKTSRESADFLNGKDTNNWH
jgi:hypothetical protein